MRETKISSEYRIGNVTLDISHMDQSEKYSDGDIENEILKKVKVHQADIMLKEDSRWPVLCHLSPERENLLGWYPFESDARILEIGSGLGALTGVLCRKAKEVHAIDISKRRSEIAAWRHSEHENLIIHVGNLSDMEFSEKFDYVTVIGVLEYAGMFIHTESPVQDFLELCRNFLKPDGVLILAIENRLGLKYWSGAMEDHTGRLFDGIMNYPEQGGVRTFSRRELQLHLESAGFPSQRWYYPHPDYKICSDIFSDDYLPRRDQLEEADSYDRKRYVLFQEKEAWNGILSAGLYPEFANSFLVFAQMGNLFLRKENFPLYIHTALSRKKAYRLSTKIVKQDERLVVHKYALNEEARMHLKTMEENGRILAELYGKEHVAQSRLIEADILEMEYVEGYSLSDIMMMALRQGGPDGLADWLNYYVRQILRGEDEILSNSYDLAGENRKYNIDLNFDNIRIRNDTFVIYDYEWLAVHAYKKHILWYVLSHFMYDVQNEVNRFGITAKSLCKALNLSTFERDTGNRITEKFYDIVLDRKVLSNYAKEKILWKRA